MVTRDRAENRDGPKVRGGRGGSRGRWSGQGTASLKPWGREEPGGSGLEGGEVRGGTQGARSWEGSCKV